MVNVLNLVSAVLCGLSVFFSIIVLGVVNGELKQFILDNTLCQFGNQANSNTDFRGCDVATAIGAISLVVALAFTVVAVVEFIQEDTLAVIATKTMLIIRGSVAGVTAFLWLVCFGVVVDEYNDNSLASTNALGGMSGAQAVSAFSFFSILTWGGLAVVLIVFRAIRGSPAGTPGGPV